MKSFITILMLASTSAFALTEQEWSDRLIVAVNQRDNALNNAIVEIAQLKKQLAEAQASCKKSDEK